MNQRTIYLKRSENNCETVKIIKGLTKIDKCLNNGQFFLGGYKRRKVRLFTGLLHSLTRDYSPTTSNSISVVFPFPKSIAALCMPSSFTSSTMLILFLSISYPF